MEFIHKKKAEKARTKMLADQVMYNNLIIILNDDTFLLLEILWEHIKLNRADRFFFFHNLHDPNTKVLD